ncbi:hypothetical protein COCOBI_13-4280 [Coccomyxa sp. Obi]|nr:hypothetical protein COCOBI_13-4280 [Coccomyxa sp. Obi]
MAGLRCLALVATSVLLFSSAQGADFPSLETLGESIRTALLNLAGVPPAGNPVNIQYNKTVGGDDGLGLALNVTGILHGPNGTAITETDTTTLGGADNYKKVHDAQAGISPKTVNIGGGKNTNLDSKNTTAGYGGEAVINKDGTFNVGGGGQVVIKDLNIGGGGGANKGPPSSSNSTSDDSKYYSPYVPPKAPPSGKK